MTCLLGIVEGNTMYLGADSVGANDHYKEVRRDSKIFRKRDMLIACTHSFRMRDIIRYDFELPEHSEGMSVEKYMVTIFINKLREKLKECGHIKKDNDGDAGCGLLIAYRGKILKIENDFQVGQSKDDYDAYGSGTYCALCSLFTSSYYDIKPEERMRLAFESCRRFVKGCCAPPYKIKKLKWR